MNTLDCIKERISVRSFTDKAVEDEKLNTIALCGLEAPTAMNSRGLTLTIVRGERLSKLNAAFKEAMDKDMVPHFTTNGEFNFYRGGNALIVVAFDGKSVLPEQNTGCVMENMYLAATELGLGACWINQFYNITSEKIRELLELGDSRPYAALSVGYIDKMPEKKVRDGQIKFLD